MTSIGLISAPAPLSAAHDLSQFDCGTPVLNDWLRNHALVSEGKSARTYVVCRDKVVVGYYCIATGSIDRRSLPPKLKRDQGLPNLIPVAIIGRLARDLSCRGAGLGPDMLRDALIRILSASQIVGLRAVLVHALDDEAASFWKAYEFVEFPAGSRTFFLPIETIRKEV
jgi:hypothetical protein